MLFVYGTNCDIWFEFQLEKNSFWFSQDADDFYPGYIPERSPTVQDPSYIHPIHNEIQETDSYNYPSTKFVSFFSPL